MEKRTGLRFTEAAIISAALIISAGVYYKRATANHIPEACASGDPQMVEAAARERVRFQDVPNAVVSLSEFCEAPLLREARRYADDGASNELYLTAVALNTAAGAVEGRSLQADATRHPREDAEPREPGSR